jgi:hypothetical protein
MARKFVIRFSSTLLLLWAAVASAQDVRSANMFKDLEQNHWAYSAVEGLRARSIVTGYPEGYFRGKRPLTRYEFAIAIDRAVKTAAAQVSSPTRTLDMPFDSHDVDTLRRLAKEFHEELASLGSDEKATTQILDSISHQIGLSGTKPSGRLSDSGANPLAAASNGTRGVSLLAPPATAATTLSNLALKVPLGGSSRPPQITLGRLNQDFNSVNLDRQGDIPTRTSLLLPAERSLAGANLNARLGSFGLQAYYGSLGAPNLEDPATVALLEGAFNGPAGFSRFGSDSGSGNPLGSLQSSRAVGVSGSVGFHLFDRMGHLRLSASSVSGQPTGNAPGGEDLTVVGATSDIQLARRLTLSAEWARSLNGTGPLSPSSAADTNAFNAMLAYNAARLNISAGYRYVDPLFSSTGYWNRIGNWLNPTNIQGPTFRGTFDLTPSFGLTFGGDYFTAARDDSPLGLDANEDIARALLGVRFGVARGLNLTADYEGVFWSLNGTRGAGSGMFHPTEHYITLGTGYNLTGSTLLRFNYQIGDFDGHGALSNGASTRSKYNTFVGQVSVKF